MAFQIPIRRIQHLPDTVEVWMPRNSRGTIQLLRLSRATREQYRCCRQDDAVESIVQSYDSSILVYYESDAFLENSMKSLYMTTIAVSATLLAGSAVAQVTLNSVRIG